MADGVDFFGTAKSNKDDVIQEGDYTPPKLNDGKLELVGTFVDTSLQCVILCTCLMYCMLQGSPLCRVCGKQLHCNFHVHETLLLKIFYCFYLVR